LLAFVLACATKSRIEERPATERQRVTGIVVFQGAADRPVVALGTVSGLSCNRDQYKAAEVTTDEAMAGLRIRAAQLGADAVTGVRCQTHSGIDYTNNCWASVTCTGDAVKFK
jgi:uncharacterized protein YbjQ (UPF0145 family)